jgi:hypothetical protein
VEWSDIDPRLSFRSGGSWHRGGAQDIEAAAASWLMRFRGAVARIATGRTVALQGPSLELPPIDVVVTMGCNVACPFLPCRHREDWGLDDPTGKGDEELLQTAKIIEKKLLDLKSRIHNLI